jgi:hypothetical protein
MPSIRQLGPEHWRSCALTYLWRPGTLHRLLAVAQAPTSPPLHTATVQHTLAASSTQGCRPRSVLLQSQPSAGATNHQVDQLVTLQAPVASRAKGAPSSGESLQRTMLDTQPAAQRMLPAATCTQPAAGVAAGARTNREGGWGWGWGWGGGGRGVKCIHNVILTHKAHPCTCHSSLRGTCGALWEPPASWWRAELLTAAWQVVACTSILSCYRQ